VSRTESTTTLIRDQTPFRKEPPNGGKGQWGHRDWGAEEGGGGKTGTNTESQQRASVKKRVGGARAGMHGQKSYKKCNKEKRTVVPLRRGQSKSEGKAKGGGGRERSHLQTQKTV